MKLLDKGYKFFWNKIVAGNDAKRMAKQNLPDGIVAVVDIPYIDDGKKEHLLDIYYPEGTEAPLPVIIDIHGGGLMYARILQTAALPWLPSVTVGLRIATILLVFSRFAPRSIG